MGSIFGVTSGKGGVGKSTCSVGLAYAFSSLGDKVLLVDMDEGLRCLDLMLGIDKTAVFDLSDVLKGADFEDALYQSPLKEGVYLIPAPRTVGQIEASLLKEFAIKAAEKFDYVIFDFPAGIDFTFYEALPEDTLFITVAVPDPVSIRDAAAVADKLGEMSLKSRLIINRFNYKQSRKYKIKNIDDIIDNTALRLLGLVPESEELLMFSMCHRLEKRGRNIKAFTRIVKRLKGNNVLLPKLKKI